MRNSIILVGLGVTLAAVSAARAQTVEAIVMPAAKPAVVAQAPVAVPPSGVVLPPEPIVAATAPVETFETVRTVTSTEPPRRVYRRVVRPWTIDRVTTVTRTTTVRTCRNFFEEVPEVICGSRDQRLAAIFIAWAHTCRPS